MTTAIAVIAAFALVAIGGVALGVARMPRGRRVTVAVGVAVAIPAVLLAVAFALAPDASEPIRCSDCVVWGGRRWEPALVLAIAAVGVLCWLGGLLLGSLTRAAARRSAG